MKKSILAIFLAVIAMAQVHAQDSDLRSAPDLPTFKVTLNYSSANTDQGTIISTVATGSKVAYNSKPVFTITAKPGYVLSDITMNTATIGTLPSGTFQNDNTTTYSYTSTALTGSTEIKAVFKAKEQVTVTISPEYATLDEIRAKVNLPKVTFDPVITGYKVQYREDGSAALTDELPEKAGLYYVVVTKSETDIFRFSGRKCSVISLSTGILQTVLEFQIQHRILKAFCILFCPRCCCRSYWNDCHCQ